MKSYILLALSGLLFTSQVLASKYYYVVCGYEGPGNEPQLSHTFARFMEVPDQMTDSNLKKMNTVDISWLPADFDRTLSLGRIAQPKPGRNFTFEETLGFISRLNQKLALGEWLVTGDRVQLDEKKAMKSWCSPVTETSKYHFDLAKKRKATLDSGKVDYQAFVPLKHSYAAGPNATGSTNCIFAVADTLLESRSDFANADPFPSGTDRGINVSKRVLGYLAKNKFASETDSGNSMLDNWIQKKLAAATQPSPAPVPARPSPIQRPRRRLFH